MEQDIFLKYKFDNWYEVIACVIHKVRKKGGGVSMEETDQINLQDLKRKVEQHEETIVQLLEIIAATNRRISDLSRKYI